MKHNYPRAQNIPGPGFAAGPCLVKDTMQLLAFAGNEFALGNAAIMINEGLPLRIVSSLRRSHDLSSMTIGLLGMAFKAESDDPRSSLSYKFKKTLSPIARKVLTTDPYVMGDPDLLPVYDVIERSDLLIVCTPHRAYRNIDLKGKPVVDVWSLYENANIAF
jgi:UDP-N-acetyl-D-mannosaminuronic acid dehydrogenase